MHRIPTVRTGFDQTFEMSLSDKAALVAMLAPFVEETVRSAIIYAWHNQIAQTVVDDEMIIGDDEDDEEDEENELEARPSAPTPDDPQNAPPIQEQEENEEEDQDDTDSERLKVLVTAQILAKAMKYHFLHPDGVTHQIKPSIMAFLNHLTSNDDEEEEDEADEEEPLPFPNLSENVQQSIGAHYQPILNSITQRDSSTSEAQASAAGLFQSVLGPLLPEPPDLQNPTDEESETASYQAEGLCSCNLCHSMDAINQEWKDWQPTDHWQVLMYNAMQSAFQNSVGV